jgi:hypothetical protein
MDDLQKFHDSVGSDLLVAQNGMEMLRLMRER